jgi:geranylgeranylglycerol-phosphate geranylgeranyltransferase
MLLMLSPKVGGLIGLFRLELPFAAGACAVLGEVLALGAVPPVREIVLGFFSLFFVSATALILNDYFDVETDRINSPQRPIPSGLVTRRDALVLSIVVALLSFASSCMLGAAALTVVCVLWIVGVMYNWRLKLTGFPGNLLVSFSVGMTFIFGGIAVGLPFEKVVIWFGVIAMLLDLGEEIAADALDIEGDKAAGSRSVPIMLGRATALRVSAAIFLLLVVVSALPFVFAWLHPVYLIPILLMDGVILYSTAHLLNPESPKPRRYVRWVYLSGLAAVLMVLVIRLVS